MVISRRVHGPASAHFDQVLEVTNILQISEMLFTDVLILGRDIEEEL